MKTKLLILLVSIFILFLSCTQPGDTVAKDNPEPEITDPEEPTDHEEPIILEPDPELVIYTNIFKVSGSSGDITTPLELTEPILKYEDTEYNIETMTPDVKGLPVKTTYTETDRIISVQITYDNFTSFYFINNNMQDIKNIDPDNMTVNEFKEMLGFIYATPEPETPYFNETRFNLSGILNASTDLLVVDTQYIIKAGIIIYFDNMDASYLDEIRTLNINMYVDNKDQFLFVNNNMQTSFNIDLQAMSYDEFVIVTDIIKRYPGEGLFDLKEEYNP